MITIWSRILLLNRCMTESTTTASLRKRAGWKPRTRVLWIIYLSERSWNRICKASVRQRDLSRCGPSLWTTTSKRWWRRLAATKAKCMTYLGRSTGTQWIIEFSTISSNSSTSSLRTKRVWLASANSNACSKCTSRQRRRQTSSTPNCCHSSRCTWSTTKSTRTSQKSITEKYPQKGWFQSKSFLGSSTPLTSTPFEWTKSKTRIPRQSSPTSCHLTKRVLLYVKKSKKISIKKTIKLCQKLGNKHVYTSFLASSLKSSTKDSRI